jgi:hypothetical protein
MAEIEDAIVRQVRHGAKQGAAMDAAAIARRLRLREGTVVYVLSRLRTRGQLTGTLVGIAA